MPAVLETAGAVAGLLECVLRLVKRIRKAYERQQNLIEVLDKHALAVQSIQDVVQAVFDEDALQTATVASELAKLEIIGKKLMRCLREQYPTDRGKLRQFTHQFIHGAKDEDLLADIMTDLDRAQATLSLRVQLANVGLTRMSNNTILANAEAINRIDRRLNEILGDGRDLKLSSLLEEANPEADTDLNHLMALSKTSVAALDYDAMCSDFDNATSTAAFDDEAADRVIVGNISQGSAIQLLGPVGKDLWEDVRVRVEKNTASGRAIQIASPIDPDSFEMLLQHQEKMTAMVMI